MEFIVDKIDRLDKFLASHHTKFSRTQWQRFIKEGVIKVNGNSVIKQGFEIRKGDRIFVPEKKILAEREKEFKIEPEPGAPLNIVYEDKDLLVINKPAGLLVHPTLSQRRHTLVNALIARYPEIIGVGDPLTSLGQVNPLRPGIVHRLDKDTSGLMVIAKNQKTFEFLKEQFLNRKIVKKYLALVEGALKEKEGVISYQIRPSKNNRLRKVAVRTLDTSGKKSIRTAETAYKVKKIYEVGARKFALLEVFPKTGRTHQIRVHLAAIGHPVVGDRMYGAKEKIAKRQLLHAASLSFTTPNGKQLILESEPPEDFKILEKR